MKNNFRILGLILLIITIKSCKEEKPTPPIITTTVVTEISYTTATSGGEVTNEGGSPIISRGVCWNTSADPTISNSKTTESGTLGVFISSIIQLTPNTIYYVRAFATNIAGTGYGNQVSFTTSQVEAPVLTTTAITAITQTTSISGGNITDDKGGSVTARGVCWSTATNPTTTNNKTTDGTGTGNFVSNLTSLQPGTIYYVRSYATNSVGTTYGNEIHFKTETAIPMLSTTEVTLITCFTAKSGGNITSDGGSTVSSCGVCWSTNQNPTITDIRTYEGPMIGSFTSSIYSLAPNTIYYVRAYAINGAGAGYGNVVTFTTQTNITTFNPNLTYSTLADIDGNVYKTIIIGSQTWMAENLKTTKYSNGTSIPFINQATWATFDYTSKAYCWNKFNIGYKDVYGAYYTWAAAMNGATSSNSKPSGVQGVCPTGWHLPSSSEWTELVTYLGGMNNAGGKMKETGTTHWLNPNYLATNDCGFTGLPGVYITRDGSYFEVPDRGVWWCSTESSSFLDAYSWFLFYDRGAISYISTYKQSGMSVRCIKDY